MLEAVEGMEGGNTGSRLPKFDGQRTSYRTWLLAFSAYVSLRYPDLVGIVDGTRQIPVPEAEQEDKDLYLRHNRQVYGAIAQCIPEWLVNTLYMSSPNDGQAALLHLRQEYGMTTAMDRAAAMARLHRCYLDPRAAIDINHVRYQYDSMREANNDLALAGGQRMPDATLITLIDGAVARCTAYDHIRMFVSRAGHTTFLAHFNDYIQVVRSEMQMAELAGEAPQHASAYSALPPHPGRHQGGRMSSVFDRSSYGKGKGGESRGSKGKGKGKSSGRASIGKGGKGGNTGAVMMCFRCGRLGHARDACRQPAGRCTRCGGDHVESLHDKADLTFGQRRALMNDARGRPNARAAPALPMLQHGGESLPELSQAAHDEQLDDTMPEDESGAYVMFAVAVPVPVYGRAARLLACAASATSLSAVSSDAVERAIESFMTEASDTSAMEGPAFEAVVGDTHDEASYSALLPIEDLNPLENEETQQLLATNTLLYMKALWESNLHTMSGSPATTGQSTSSDAGSSSISRRLLNDCPRQTTASSGAGPSVSSQVLPVTRERLRLHHQDIHMACLNAALFQVSVDVLGTSTDEVHTRSEVLLQGSEAPTGTPTGDADLDRLYRCLWAL